MNYYGPRDINRPFGRGSEVDGAKPRRSTCCEACVWGRGPHADWCPVAKAAAVAKFHKNRKVRP